MSQDAIVQAIERAILPVLTQEGYELVLTEYVPRARVVRLFIDREGGVGIDDCQKVSRVVSDVMDAEGLSDNIDGRFTLEVSSPGLDRPLVKPKDFQRFAGRRVNVATHEMIEGRRKFSGELAVADERGIQVSADGRLWAIPYEAIDRARLVPEFD